MQSFVCFSLAFLIVLSGQVVLSADTEDGTTKNPNPFEINKTGVFSNHSKSPEYERHSTFLGPIASKFIPGLGSFMNGQGGAGAVYAGTALAGVNMARMAANSINADEFIDETDISVRDDRVRRLIFGLGLYDLSGSLSMYHHFQTAVEFRQEKGDYQFLPDERETTADLMLAPFAFSHITRSTTWIPLTVGLAAMFAVGQWDDYDTRGLNSSDVAFSAGISYQAGVGEEAMFRGWLFPVLVEAYGVENMFWANATQALIFGAAHYGPGNQAPIFQTLAGYYFGYLAQKNNWSLQEAIFVHTWWDVIVFTASYTQGNKKASIYVPLYQSQF